MTADIQKLLLDRVEFRTIKIDVMEGEFNRSDIFPQLDFDSADLKYLVRSDLYFPEEELDDPRIFMLSYGVKVDSADQTTMPPYELEVEAVAYFRYVAGEEFSGEHRFRAVRFSGYQILYGAIREMVSNLTARSSHGTWNLPARNFNGVAEARAKEDEAERLARVEERDARLKKQTRKLQVHAAEIGVEAKEKPKRRATKKSDTESKTRNSSTHQ